MIHYRKSCFHGISFTIALFHKIKSFSSFPFFLSSKFGTSSSILIPVNISICLASFGGNSNHISAKAVAVIKRPKVPRFNLRTLFRECLYVVVDDIVILRTKYKKIGYYKIMQEKNQFLVNQHAYTENITQVINVICKEEKLLWWLDFRFVVNRKTTYKKAGCYYCFSYIVVQFCPEKVI